MLRSPQIFGGGGGGGVDTMMWNVVLEFWIFQLFRDMLPWEQVNTDYIVLCLKLI